MSIPNSNSNSNPEQKPEEMSSAAGCAFIAVFLVCGFALGFGTREFMLHRERRQQSEAHMAKLKAEAEAERRGYTFSFGGEGITLQPGESLRIPLGPIFEIDQAEAEAERLREKIRAIEKEEAEKNPPSNPDKIHFLDPTSI